MRNIAGDEGIGKVRHEIVNLLRGPVAGFVGSDIGIGFVLDGERVKGDAVLVLHVDHVTGELAGVGLIVGWIADKVAAIHVGVALECACGAGLHGALQTRAPRSRANCMMVFSTVVPPGAMRVRRRDKPRPVLVEK